MKRFIRFFFNLLGIIILFSSCNAGKNTYNAEYERKWKEIVKSEAWKQSLQENNEKVASVALEKNLNYQTNYTEKETINADFEEKFNSLVSQAYHKIITEARVADTRLREEYEKYANASKTMIKADPDYKKNFELVKKRYEAHQQMLEGLVSWNIFSEKMTGDLNYFKKENIDEVYLRHSQGQSEKTLVSHLVYKLADLYHTQ